MMARFKKFLKILGFPPLWLLFLLIIVSVVLLVIALGTNRLTGPIVYGVYLISAYTLVAAVLDLVMVVPDKYKRAKQQLLHNSIGSKLIGDPVFRVQVMLYASLTINLFYVATNLVSGYLYESNWFVTLALYYLLLSLMRFILLHQLNHKKQSRDMILEYNRSRWCGIILLVITLALSVVLFMVIYAHEGYDYNGVLIYAMASYTFYIFTMAIINMVRYKKYNSPVLSAVKTVNFVSALVSMLALETAMLSQFGSDNHYPYFNEIMIGTSGTAICLTIGVMAIRMIIKSTREIKIAQTKKGLFKS